MDGAVIELSLSKDVWDKPVTVIGDKANTLYVKIEPNGSTMVRLIFPVAGLLPWIEGEIALADKSIWESTPFTMQPEIPTPGISCTIVKNLTAFNITFPKSTDLPTKPVVFILKLTAAKMTEDTAIAYCRSAYFAGKGWVDMDKKLTIQMVKQLKIPVIKNFTTTDALVKKDQEFTLEWHVDEAEDVILQVKEEKSYLEKLDAQGKLTKNTITQSRTYILTAKNREFSTSKIVTVLYYANTSIDTVSVPEFKNNLLNLITTRDTLYALVKKQDEAKQDVVMWQTRDGVNWELSSAESFNKSKVPLQFAGSGSIAYNGTIYLIGGSRFNQDIRSNDVYYLELNQPENTKGIWKKHPQINPFSKRMGHTVVEYSTSNVSELYLLGGLGAQGTLKDVYRFTGDRWIEVKDLTMQHALCMHNSIVANNNIQVWGGFGRMPGDVDQKLESAVSVNPSEKKWNEIAKNSGGELLKKELLSCAIAMLDCLEFVFCRYFNSADELRHDVFKIVDKSKLEQVKIAGTILLADYFAGIQAVTFKNAIWFCAVNDDGEFKSIDLTYFVFKT